MLACFALGARALTPVLWSRLRRELTAACIALAVIAVGSFFADPAAAASKQRQKAGSIEIKITGLPSGSRPNAVLHGPHLRKRVTKSTVRIPRVHPGKYTLKLSRTTVKQSVQTIQRGATAFPSQGAARARTRVRAGKAAHLKAAYGTIVNPGVRQISSADVVLVEGDPTNPTAIVLSGDSAPTVGSTLSIPPSTKLPNGLLARVTTVTTVSNGKRVSLELMSPFSVVPVADYAVPLTFTGDGAGLRRRAAGCGTTLGGISPIRKITNPRFEGSWNTVGVLGHGVPVGVKAQVHFTIQAGISAQASAGVECHLSADVALNGMAGPIPITGGIGGDIKGSVGAGGTLSATGSVDASVGVETVASIAYPTLSVGRPRFAFDASTFARATANLGVNIFFGLGNDYVAALTARFGSSLDFTAEPGSCSWEANFGQFSVEGKIGPFDLESPSTPPFFTKTLWQNSCGGDDPPPGPANDDFASAASIGVPGSAQGSNVGATREADEPTASDGGSVWYRWTPSSSGIAGFDTCTSSFDTVLGVYTGSTLEDLEFVDEDDDGCSSGTGSRVAFYAEAGTTYRIAVSGYDADSTGTFTLAGSRATTRFHISWNTDADIDLHVFDDDFDHAYYEDQEAIPGGLLSEDIIPDAGDSGPHSEQFDVTGSDALFACVHYYADPDDEPEATPTHYTITNPNGTQSSGTITLTEIEEGAVIGASPAGALSTPESSACGTSEYFRWASGANPKVSLSPKG